MKKTFLFLFLLIVIVPIAYSETYYQCVSTGLFSSVFSGANLTNALTAPGFFYPNGTSCCGAGGGGGTIGESKWIDKGTFIMPNASFAADVTINGTLSAISLNGSMGWANLTTYPTGCIDGTYLTAINDTLTCGTPPDNDSGVGGNATIDFFDTLIEGKLCLYNSSTGDIACNQSVVVDTDTFYRNATVDFVDTFMNRTDWTTIDSYPTGCIDGTYVVSVNDTLICATPPDNDTFYRNKTIDFADTFMNRTDWATIDDYPNNCSANNYVSGFEGDALLCAVPTDLYYRNTTLEIRTAVNGSNTVLPILNITSYIMVYNTSKDASGLIFHNGSGLCLGSCS